MTVLPTEFGGDAANIEWVGRGPALRDGVLSPRQRAREHDRTERAVAATLSVAVTAFQ